MDKYKKLLESTVPEDIALGLFLCEREGLLTEGRYSLAKAFGMAIQFDGWSVWCNKTEFFMNIKSTSGGFRWGGNNFDFRTKKEEKV